MGRDSVLQDIKHDLEGMPTELLAHLKQLADDASPAIGSAVHDARSRGAAVGTTLAGHIPDQVIDRVPDAISDKLPTQSSGGSKLKKLLLFGGIAGAAAAAAALWRRQQATQSQTPAWMQADSSQSPNGVAPEDVAVEVPGQHRDI